jgi:ABC-type transporter Mla subunit MlaD
MIDVRDRITERINRARLALEIRRGAGPLVVVLVGVAIGLGCALYVLANIGKSLYTGTRELKIELADARGIIKGGRQELRFKGIQAGTIGDVRLEGGHAVATVKLYKEFGPIYRDARVTLRPNTALEDMYIDILDRGTRSAGVATVKDPLLARQVEDTVQAEDVLNALQPDVRVHMATLLRNLGNGLDDRGDDLRTAFVNAVPFVENADRLLAELAERRRLTQALISDTASLTGELGRRDASLRRLVGTAGVTLRTLEERSPELDATIAELPPTLERIDSSFAAVRDVLPAVDDAVDGLVPVAERLPASLAGLRRLSATLQPAAAALRTPVRRLVPFASALRPASLALRDTAASLRPLTDEIDYVTKSVAGCSIALQGFFQWTASLTKIGDATNGPPGRGDLNLALDSATAIKDPNTFVPPSCAPGAPIGGEPGPGGDLKP